jgi:hypothetical protein
MRTIVVALSDTHANHRLGLLAPETVLYEEDPATREMVPWSPSLGPTQRWLWPEYNADRRGVVDLANGDRIVLIHEGDMCQGGNGNPHELVSMRLADQIAIAAENLRPWFELPNLDRAIFIKGTAYHELGEGSAAMLVAAQLRAEYGKQIEVPYHADAMIDGVSFDLAHHGPPPGVRTWLRGNILRLYTQSLMDRALMEGQEPPRVLLRGHYHELTSEVVTRRARGRKWTTDAWICPAYCGIDEYARKVSKSPGDLTVGLLAFELVDGELRQTYEFKRTIDYRTRIIV